MVRVKKVIQKKKHAKLHGELKEVVQDFSEEPEHKHEELVKKHDSMQLVKKKRIKESDTTKISVIVKLKDEYNPSKKKFHVMYLPVKDLPKLNEDKRIEKVYPSKKKSFTADTALTMVKVNRIENGIVSRLPGVPDGSGVIIGILDSGIDYLHPMFDDRVAYVWDLSSKIGKGWSSMCDYGTVFARNPDSSLNEFGLEEYTGDTLGHGTHVSGIAAGNDPKYGGVAPKATIVVVGKSSGLSDADILHGVEFVTYIADKLNMPAVINLSLSDQGAPHDGSSVLSQALNEYIRPGIIICAAAGNDGWHNSHASPKFINNTAIFNFRFLNGSSCSMNIVLDGDEEFTFRIVQENGFETPWFNIHDKPLWRGSNPRYPTTVTWAIDSAGMDEQDIQLKVVLFSRISGNVSSQFELQIQSPVHRDIHGWMIIGNNGEFYGDSVSNSHKIGSPGSSEAVITVGAVQSRLNWDSDVGNIDAKTFDKLVKFGASKSGELAPFSSPGPLRKSNCLKPDICAPGMFIISASASNPTIVEGPYQKYGRYLVLAGTSQACPVVCGLIALMLQYNNQLTKEKVMEQFRKLNNNSPWNPQMGYGLASYSDIQIPARL